MDIKKSFGTSQTLENEGVWIELGEGASIKVARMGNKENKALLKKLIAPHKMAARNDKLADEIWEKITVESMAATILLDWKGIEDEGKTLPYSKENAIRLLTDYKDFREQVASFSSELALFQSSSEAAAIKN
jgi:hypothetical protein